MMFGICIIFAFLLGGFFGFIITVVISADKNNVDDNNWALFECAVKDEICKRCTGKKQNDKNYNWRVCD